MMDPACLRVVMRDPLFAAWIGILTPQPAALPEPEWERMSIDMVDRRGRFTEEEFGQLSNPAKAHIEHAPYWTKVEGVYRNTGWSE